MISLVSRSILSVVFKSYEGVKSSSQVNGNFLRFDSHVETAVLRSEDSLYVDEQSAVPPKEYLIQDLFFVVATHLIKDGD